MRMARRLTPAVGPLARLALVATLLLSIGDVVLAQSQLAPAMAEDQRLLPYVEPGQLVDIGGRRINLHCTGSGAPTVVLMAGLSSWSPVWYKTQPVIAQKTRVCAFDRASFDFIDPAPRPQILSDTVNDLHAALKTAPIPGPYVLVGHSLGGVEARLYAQRWPKDVAGMILVDTSPAEEGSGASAVAGRVFGHSSMCPLFGRAVKWLEVRGFAPCIIVALRFQAARSWPQSPNAPEPLQG